MQILAYTTWDKTLLSSISFNCLWVISSQEHTKRTQEEPTNATTGTAATQHPPKHNLNTMLHTTCGIALDGNKKQWKLKAAWKINKNPMSEELGWREVDKKEQHIKR